MDDNIIEYDLVRSKRKTTALYIRDGRVEVRAPLKLPKSIIDRFVMSKQKWIEEKLAITNEVLAQRESFALDYGSQITYRGRQYPIAAKEGNRIGFGDDSFYMPPELPPESIKRICIEIYRLLARRDLTNRTIEIAEIMSANPSSVKITNARTQWGSCTSKGSINYSWRLIIADDELIDYIIVHELAHLTEMNHSERFWDIVQRHVPDYSERRTRLNALQHKLAGEDWN
ncbi:MAG: M48 family metallopeptidase [Oscillospiraceae bacterium]|nr:M48 family metallopeptidase [Oscillospiraceae bacterium]